jgi:hypothetical protein
MPLLDRHRLLTAHELTALERTAHRPGADAARAGRRACSSRPPTTTPRTRPAPSSWRASADADERVAVVRRAGGPRPGRSPAGAAAIGNIAVEAPAVPTRPAAADPDPRTGGVGRRRSRAISLPARGTPEGAEWEPLHKALDRWDTATIRRWIGRRAGSRRRDDARSARTRAPRAAPRTASPAEGPTACRRPCGPPAGRAAVAQPACSRRGRGRRGDTASRSTRSRATAATRRASRPSWSAASAGGAMSDEPQHLDRPGTALGVTGLAGGALLYSRRASAASPSTSRPRTRAPDRARRRGSSSAAAATAGRRARATCRATGARRPSTCARCFC